jgi:hypothetical protein
MKQWLTLILTLTFLVVFTGPGAAQQKAGEKETPGALRRGPTGVTVSGVAKTMTAKVTQLNEPAKIFVVMDKGKAVTFSAAKLGALPKVGQNIDITYTGVPGGPLEATTVKSSKSNTSE